MAPKKTKSGRQTPTSQTKPHRRKSTSKHKRRSSGKRSANNKHKQRFPGQTDDQIRDNLYVERKEKNKRSAKKSRETKKKKLGFLDAMIPRRLRAIDKLQYCLQVQDETDKENNSNYCNGNNSCDELLTISNIIHTYVALKRKQYYHLKDLNVHDEVQKILGHIIEKRLTQMENNCGADSDSDSDSDIDIDSDIDPDLHEFIKEGELKWALNNWFSDVLNDCQYIGNGSESHLKKSKKKTQMEQNEIEVEEEEEIVPIFLNILPKLHKHKSRQLSTNSKTDEYRLRPKKINSIPLMQYIKPWKKLNINGIRKYKQQSISESQTTISIKSPQKSILLSSQYKRNDKRKLDQVLEDIENVIKVDYTKPPTKKQKVNQNVETDYRLNSIRTNGNQFAVPPIATQPHNVYNNQYYGNQYYDNQYYDHSRASSTTTLISQNSVAVCTTPTPVRGITPTSVRSVTPLNSPLNFQTPTKIRLPPFNYDNSKYIGNIDSEQVHYPSAPVPPMVSDSYYDYNQSPYVTAPQFYHNYRVNVNNRTPLPHYINKPSTYFTPSPMQQHTSIPSYYKPSDDTYTQTMYNDNSQYIGSDDDDWRQGMPIERSRFGGV